MAETVPFRYRAFLSYSHRDKAWGDWLQRALEGYRIDKDLVGRQTPAGPVPKTLRPIFLDRDDFSAGHSLTEQTIAALEASQFLLVLCSPNAAQSQYVNEEIRRFKAMGRAARVSLAIRERLAKADPGNVQWRNDLQFTIGRIAGLVYPFVLAGDFTNALDAADRVIALAPDELGLHGNRAHALMFLGRVEEARAIYLAHRGTRNVVGEKSWETAVLEDFAELRAAKLAHPLMDEIEKLFTARP